VSATFCAEGVRASGSTQDHKVRRADAWITWKAVSGARPDIRPTGWGGITITASSIVIDGLNVTGDFDYFSVNPRFLGHIPSWHLNPNFPITTTRTRNSCGC